MDQRSGDWNSRYTFSGKERDEETGYSYFGARYYDADLSIWLSRDPLADKYPYQSPYVYCGNNPLKIIDPDGRDEWELNKKTGEVKWKNDNGGEKNHSLHVYDKNGKSISSVNVKDRKILESLEIGRGSVNSYDAEGNRQSSTTERYAYGGKNSKGDILNIFHFASTNSDVEWSLNYANVDGEAQYAIGSYGRESYSRGEFFNSQDIITSIHSHPGKAKGTNYNKEIQSMKGDMNQTTNYSRYVSMPNSTRLFNVKKGQASYIRNINGNPSRFVNIGGR